MGDLSHVWRVSLDGARGFGLGARVCVITQAFIFGEGEGDVLMPCMVVLMVVWP